MCDDHSINDMLEHAKQAELSRRSFGALSVSAGLALMLPQVAGAAEVTEKDIEIKTPDGTCDAYFVHPTSGKHPAVLVWADAFGLRPAFKQMAKRLAESGYAVLVPNPFYRKKKAPVVAEGASFADPEVRKTLFEMMGSLNPDTHVADAKTFIAFLDAQGAVDTKRKMGTTGYCMGGPIVMRTAAAFPDRVGAAGSFHGGGLVTTATNSPHLLIPKAKAQFLIAIADNDDKQQPQAKDDLKKAFADANVKAEVEVYTGAQHGWCPPDSQVYNQAQAEKAWTRMLETFKTGLV
jgi:carboxymethylenebutenolidase